MYLLGLRGGKIEGFIWENSCQMGEFLWNVSKEGIFHERYGCQIVGFTWRNMVAKCRDLHKKLGNERMEPHETYECLKKGSVLETWLPKGGIYMRNVVAKRRDLYFKYGCQNKVFTWEMWLLN